MIEVKKSDFEVFEALEDDIANEEKTKVKDNSKREPIGDLSGSPPGVYSQDIPTGYESSAGTSSRTGKTTNPPVLPPYLLEVILNNPKSFHDKILLPQPNHVMLNHLYALSIQVSLSVNSFLQLSY